jgi:hypothetical protein
MNLCKRLRIPSVVVMLHENSGSTTGPGCSILSVINNFCIVYPIPRVEQKMTLKCFVLFFY